jgi:hypothetical protein
VNVQSLYPYLTVKMTTTIVKFSERALSTKGEIALTEFKDEEDQKVEEDYYTPLYEVTAPDQGIGWWADCSSSRHSSTCWPLELEK